MRFAPAVWKQRAAWKLTAGHPADLVHFVHSLYYVADLSAALDHAISMVRPGGLLVAAIAPLRSLCVLTELLCPWAGPKPWFAEDVCADLESRGLRTRTETIVGPLAVRDVLDDPLGRGEDVLDFLIGARCRTLASDSLAELLDYLREISLPGQPGVLPTRSTCCSPGCRDAGPGLPIRGLAGPGVGRRTSISGRLIRRWARHGGSRRRSRCRSWRISRALTSQNPAAPTASYPPASGTADRTSTAHARIHRQLRQ